MNVMEENRAIKKKEEKPVHLNVVRKLLNKDFDCLCWTDCDREAQDERSRDHQRGAGHVR